MDQACESIPAADFECKPVEQLSQMEVDDIVISNDDELKSDKRNDLYSMTSDPYVESIEPKHFHEGMRKINVFKFEFSRITHPMCLQQSSIFEKPFLLSESDVESYNDSEAAKPPSPVIDENARASAHDNDNLHQVIDLSPNQILPATDENAVDSMDFENQFR